VRQLWQALDLKRGGWWLSLAAVLALVLVGVVGLADAVTWEIALIVAIAALLAALRTFDEVVGQLLGAVLVGTLTLIGFNVLTDSLVRWLGWGRTPILAGLVIAVIVFAAAGGWYLRRAEWSRRRAAPVSVGLAIFLILVVPILVERHTAEGGAVPTAERVASAIDVLVVTDGLHGPPPPSVAPDTTTAGFDVRYSVGYAAGDGVRWTLAGSPSADDALRVAAQGDTAPVASAPKLRDGADPVLVLLVDGTPPVLDAPNDLPNVPGHPGEVDRWARVAHAAAPATAPKFALLQTTNRARLSRWSAFTRRGDDVSLQVLGARTVTGAALRLATAAPTADSDFALALEHRPILLFDQSEPVPRPLSVAWLFADGRVSLCRDRGVIKTRCEAVTRPAELENGGTHLELTLPKSRALRAVAKLDAERAAAAPAAPPSDQPGAPPGGAEAPPMPAHPQQLDQPPTAIYVHPVPVERNGQSLLYLDYWWYLPDNPAGVAGGAFCGAGLVIPGITCQDHLSDWEGMTVVIDRTGPRPLVTAVVYGQHNTVVRYPWQQLRQRWDGDPALSRFFAAIPDASGRPLAFIAKGTHAAYALPCGGGCRQVADHTLGDGPHRGGLAWVGNDTAICQAIGCLQPLPAREGGRQPALWNAFTGTWGDRHCALTYYCDSGSPPAAPGHQYRYTHPTQCTGVIDPSWRFRRHGCD
jgi:hypothetical protein